MTAATETAAIGELVAAGQDLVASGLSPGASGNLSVRIGDRVHITPTGARLAALDPAGLAVLTLDGTRLSGPPASKEFPLHLACYRRDPAATAVVHLHSPHAAAYSCLPPWSDRSAVPPLTPYFVMRVGQTPLIPYAAPGDPAQAESLRTLDFPFRAALLQNHGSITTGRTLAGAVDAAAELEEATRLLLLLGPTPAPRHLTPSEATALADRYGTPWDDPRT